MAARKARSKRPKSRRKTAKKPAAKRAKPRAKKRPAKRPAKRAAKRVARAKRPSARRAAKPAAPEAIPSAIGCLEQHLDYTSHDLAGIQHFYGEILGFRSLSMDPDFGYLTIRTGASSTLGFMSPMPGPPEQWRPPGEPALYFLVKDVDAAYRALSERGVAFQEPPTDQPWNHRTAVLRDPEGRMIFLATPLAK